MNPPVSEESPPSFGRFFLPGPTEVRPDVLEAQARAMIGHRGPRMEALMEELQEGLKPIFSTKRPVFIATSSATGLMEAAARNGAAGRVLSLVNGAFSERFAEIARACGREVDEIVVPPGDHNSPERLQAHLERYRYDAVTVVHSETSTGVLNPLAEIAAVVGEYPQTLLLVDAVTSAGGTEVLADEWGLDFVLTGSQKALALPPGLAFGVASEAMMQRSRAMQDTGVYFALEAYASRMSKLQTPTTPALSLLYALQFQLRRIARETVEGRWRRHREMAERTWSWVDGMREEKGVELTVLADEGYRSPTVTCIRLPEGNRGPAVVDALAERGWVIGSGYGRLKEGTVRIGHMGDHTLDELNRLLEGLEDVLE